MDEIEKPKRRRRKRWVPPPSKTRKLKFSYKDNSFTVSGSGVGSSDNARLLFFAFTEQLSINSKTFIDELSARGFDPKTIKFEIQKAK